MSSLRGTDKLLIRGLKSTPLGREAIDSSTTNSRNGLIHNLAQSPFPRSMRVLRMRPRQPLREPFRPCMVAVLDDQEG